MDDANNRFDLVPEQVKTSVNTLVEIMASSDDANLVSTAETALMNVLHELDTIAHPTKALAAQTNNELEHDFQYARLNLQEILQKGSQALEEMSEIAKQSQHPHSYRVLAELMTSLVNANEHVLDLHAQKQDIQPTLTPEANKPLIGNAMFVGSTAELLTMLNQQRKANN